MVLIIIFATVLLHLSSPARSAVREPFMGLGGAPPASPPPSSDQSKPVGSDQSKPAGSDTATQQPGGIQWTNPWSGLCTGQDANWSKAMVGPKKKVALSTCIDHPDRDGCDAIQVVVGDDNKITVKDCSGNCPDSDPTTPGCTLMELNDGNCQDPRTALIFNSCANQQIWSSTLQGRVNAVKALAGNQTTRELMLKANEAHAMNLRQMMLLDAGLSIGSYEGSAYLMGGASNAAGAISSSIKSIPSASSKDSTSKKTATPTKPAKSGGLF